MCAKHYGGDSARRCLKYLYGLKYSNLVRSSWSFSRDEYWAYQSRRLAVILRYAVENIPYYKKRSEEYLHGDIAVGSGTRQELLEALARLPVLRKETVREDNLRFMDPHKSLTRTYNLTSGTTGSPLKIAVDIWERSLTAEILHQWYGRLTGGKYPRTLMLRGFWVHGSDDDIFWRSRLTGDMHLSIYSMRNDRADAIVEMFDVYEPVLIMGYPSAINQLALLVGERLAGSRDARIAFVVSEALQPQWRRNIEAMLCEKVYELYSSEEGAHLVMQCPEGTMHVNPLKGIVEILKESGEAAGIGESGRVIVTGLSMTSMPLVRYDLGDIAVSTGYDQVCRCGLRWPGIGGIDGREEEQITARDGRRFAHLMRFAVRDLDGIGESQLIQVDYESFVMKIVTAGNVREQYMRRNEAKIKQEIERRMGTKVEIAFEYVEEIPRTVRGKFKATVVAMDHAEEKS